MEELLNIQKGLESCQRILSMALNALKHELTPEEEETIYTVVSTQAETLISRTEDLLALNERLKKQ